MDQPMGTQPQVPQAPVQPAAPPPPPMQGPPQSQPGQTPPAKKKSNVWLWVLGGCLLIVILTLGIIFGLGWWGARKVKKEVEKYQPNLEEMKKNADEWSKEAEEWQKKSQGFQENLPNPEDMPSQFPEGSNPNVQ